MKIIGQFAILISIAILSHVVCYPEEEDVLVLGQDNFDQAINEHEFLLVEFYAPWCGHCKALAPEYAKAAATLKTLNPPVFLAKVDATLNQELGERYGVKGYPTIKFFNKGKYSEYNGDRNEKAIVIWMKKKTGPASTEIHTIEELNKISSENEVLLVFLGSNAESFAIYETTARTNDDFIFCHCKEELCLNHFNLKDGNVVLLKHFDEKRNDLTASLKDDILNDFISKNSAPTIMQFDQKCAQKIFSEHTPGFILYIEKEDQSLLRLFNEIALSYKGVLQAVISGISQGIESKLAEYVGVKEDHLPSIRIHDTRGELKNYIFKGEFTKEAIIRFIDDWKEYKLKPMQKTEDVPEVQLKPVYKIVGKAFEEVVYGQKRDVLVKFYAPWCGHCKQMAPVYEELARRLKHNKNVLIAEFDATTNETEKVKVTGFPTIKFFKHNEKTPMEFNGNRDDVSSYLEFLTKNSNYSFTVLGDEL